MESPHPLVKQLGTNVSNCCSRARHQQHLPDAELHTSRTTLQLVSTTLGCCVLLRAEHAVGPSGRYITPILQWLAARVCEACYTSLAWCGILACLGALHVWRPAPLGAPAQENGGTHNAAKTTASSGQGIEILSEKCSGWVHPHTCLTLAASGVAGVVHGLHVTLEARRHLAQLLPEVLCNVLQSLRAAGGSHMYSPVITAGPPHLARYFQQQRRGGVQMF